MRFEEKSAQKHISSINLKVGSYYVDGNNQLYFCASWHYSQTKYMTCLSDNKVYSIGNVDMVREVFGTITI